MLTPWEKLLAMAIAASVVLLALIAVVCFVGPGCWGYAYLRRAEERKRQRLLSKFTLKPCDEVKLTDIAYDTAKRNSILSTGSLLSGKHRDSTYSSMSEDSRKLSIKSTSTCSEVPLPAVLTLGLKYISSDNNGTGKLLIHVKGVKRLPPREYLGGMEPYLVLQVVKTSWPLHRRAGPPLHEMRTRTLRHSYSPHFDQTFTLEAKKTDIKEWCLKITAYDQDKFASPTELCHTEIMLKDVKQLTALQEEIVLSYNLAPSSREVGQILFGLSFLPTAQRMSISIIKAASLRYHQVAESLDDFNPYVRVLHLNCSTGRSIRRKKTGLRPGGETADFNETLTFDMTSSQLDASTFLVMLCSRTKQGDAIIDKCLGKVAVGGRVGGKRQRDHWLAVLQAPRTVVSVWHPLK